MQIASSCVPGHPDDTVRVEVNLSTAGQMVQSSTNNIVLNVDSDGRPLSSNNLIFTGENCELNQAIYTAGIDCETAPSSVPCISTAFDPSDPTHRVAVTVFGAGPLFDGLLYSCPVRIEDNAASGNYTLKCEPPIEFLAPTPVGSAAPTPISGGCVDGSITVVAP